jgi:protein TonB
MSALALDVRPAPTLPSSAILISVAIHVAALLLLPGLAKQAEELPPLIATLRLLPASAPAASEPVKTPAPQPQAHPTSATPRPTPIATKTPLPSPHPVQDAAPASAETVAVAAPSANPARSEAPPAAAPIAAAPAPVPDSTALDEYGRALSDLLSRQQQYPRLAALRGWEGEVRLRLKVARKGNLVAVQIVHSSGHEVLDQHAVQLVQGAALPNPPESVGDREIQVVVPIHYKLQKSS